MILPVVTLLSAIFFRNNQAPRSHARLARVGESGKFNHTLILLLPNMVDRKRKWRLRDSPPLDGGLPPKHCRSCNRKQKHYKFECKLRHAAWCILASLGKDKRSRVQDHHRTLRSFALVDLSVMPAASDTASGARSSPQALIRTKTRLAVLGVRGRSPRPPEANLLKRLSNTK